MIISTAGNPSNSAFTVSPGSLLWARSSTTDAKLLYGLMLDRMGLSARNGWYNEENRVFIYYPLDEIKEALNCGNDKAVKLLAELDTGKGIGLIQRVK